ncbi:MAG TPA: aminoacyl-tRNA hydrolase [Massilibacterium sp.]|nr:aminoacyl-tRNA hydrolase [Massilibacterium sp.]
MKCFVGLGNPGKKYEQTRHNIGFRVIDELAEKWDISLNQEKFKGIYGSGIVNGEKVFLIKPITYMNISGECVRPFLDYFKIPLEELVVIYDDLDLPTGRVRLRQKGSAGGHNGIKSLISHLGTEKFNRLRIGISRPQTRMPIPDYVLGPFSTEEQKEIQEAIHKAADACESFLTNTFLEVMNKYN